MISTTPLYPCSLFFSVTHCLWCGCACCSVYVSVVLYHLMCIVFMCVCVHACTRANSVLNVIIDTIITRSKKEQKKKHRRIIDTERVWESSNNTTSPPHTQHAEQKYTKYSLHVNVCRITIFELKQLYKSNVVDMY